MPAVTLEADQTPRFAFGQNWSEYLAKLTPERQTRAQRSLEAIFGPDGLRGKTFLDAGCGSGLFSLAAYRMGATVTSIDIDPHSVACAEELRRREPALGERWEIELGSALDEAGLARLGTFEVVYSWGVLHHTGDMWRAIELVQQRTAVGGTLWLAIYNDQESISRMWKMIKQVYVTLPRVLQTPYVALVGGFYYGQRAVARLCQMLAASLMRLVTLKNPLTPWFALSTDLMASQRSRGMDWWTDLVDWIGGYPFEVAKPEELFRFLRDRGFRLQEITTCGGGLGCNELVFVREAATKRVAGKV